MALFVQVSSIKTNRAGSNMPCSRIQRRRARITSMRFCSAAYKVFFKGDVVTLVEPPHRSATALDSGSRHCQDDLIEGHVGLLHNQPEQEFRVFIERRDAAAALLCFDASGLVPTLHPNHYHAGAEPIEFRNLTPRCPTFNCLNYPHTQILRIRLRHWFPPQANQCARFAHSQALGNPPNQPDSIRSENALRPHPEESAKRASRRMAAGDVGARGHPSRRPRQAARRLRMRAVVVSAPRTQSFAGAARE